MLVQLFANSFPALPVRCIFGMWDSPFRPAPSPAETSCVVKKIPSNLTRSLGEDFLLVRFQTSQPRIPQRPASAPRNCWRETSLPWAKKNRCHPSHLETSTLTCSWHGSHQNCTCSTQAITFCQLPFIQKQNSKLLPRKHDVCSIEKCRIRCTLNSYHTQLASSQRIVYFFPLAVNSSWVNQQLHAGLLEHHLKDLLFQSW